MLYIGAEFCPYCAATRWSMAIALSRFGTLTPLHGIHSSSTDADPNTATLTFYKSGLQQQLPDVHAGGDRERQPALLLQNPTARRTRSGPSTSRTRSTRGYPFIAFGNKFVLKAPIYDPGVLAGKTWSQIAAALKDPTSPVAQSVNGAANYITGAICKMTNNQPSDVCSSPAVQAVQSGL